MKNYFITGCLVLTLLIPNLVLAQTGGTGGDSSLLPDCGIVENGRVNRECGYNDLLQLVINIINWIIVISFPVSAGVIAWAGFKFMTTGVVDERSAAKKMITKVFWGYAAILAAWVIVNTVLNTLLSDDSEIRRAIPLEGINK